MNGYDVIVVGAGSVGSFTAFHLTRDGRKVLVAERGGVAAGTSRASDGNLLMSDKPAPGTLFELMRQSLKLWAEAIAELGNDCEFDVKGSTVVTLDPGQVDALEAHVRAHAAGGVRTEMHRDGWLAIEPELGPETCAVGWWPDDVQVNPMLASYSIARHLRTRGAAYRLHDEVTAWQATPQGVEVQFASGEKAAAGQLVFCTGVWTPALLAPRGIKLPIEPRKGQIGVLERGDVAVRSKIADFAYNATVEEGDPRDPVPQTAAIIESTQSGTILCGSSRAFAGFDTTIDTATLGRQLALCRRIVPRLQRLRVIRAYAGLRPFSPDGLPTIGPVDDDGRVFVATGHEGTGHGLAPVTGALIAALIAGGQPPLAAAVDPRRFLR